MTTSFAQLHRVFLATGLALALAACATLPPPTSELGAAEQAVARAESADAMQHAAAELGAARALLAQARGELGDDDDTARRLALMAAAEADLAYARSRLARATALQAQHAADANALQARLGLDGQAQLLAPAQATPGPAALRLQALAGDPRLAGLAQLERWQAQQALDALAQARARERPDAERLAERRVQAAEAAAWAQAIERDAERLEREARDLQLEATRREAAEARAEADRLRLEAQARAEETERLRAQAQADEEARRQAEQALEGAAGETGARAAAARAQELALAREEAELVADGKLPPVRRTEAGELYTLAGDAFPTGQATLTGSAERSLKALAAYLAIAKPKAVRVVGHTDAQGEAAANLALSERRAAAVRQALVAAGLKAALVQAAGRGAQAPVADNATAAGRARNRRVEIAVELE